MKRTALVLAVMVLLVLCMPQGVHAAYAADTAHFERVFNVSFRELTYLVDSSGVLWTYDIRLDVDDDTSGGAPEKVMENIAVMANADFSHMALDGAGGLWAWGLNDSGNLGFAGMAANPVKVLDNIADFSMGGGYSLAVDKNGGLWYMYGGGDSAIQYIPAMVMDGVKAVCADGSVPMAIKTDDSLWTISSEWDDYLDTWNHTPVKLMDNAVTIKFGMAIDKDGVLWSFDADNTPVKRLENAVDMTGVYQQNRFAQDASGGLWAWSADSGDAPVKIAENCSYLVKGTAGEYVYYINTKAELCRLASDGKAPVILETEVIFATGPGDVSIACVKKDGSGVYIYFEMDEEFPEARNTFSKNMLVSPYTGTGAGVPLYDGYQAAIAPTSSFKDIANHWGEKEILRWAGYGVIQGHDGMFRPDDTITRAEFSAVLNRIMGYTGRTDEVFTDVAAGAWYRLDIEKVYTAGIMQGDGKGNMRPTDTITCEEAVVMLARAFHLGDSAENAGYENVSTWAVAAVNDMHAKGYLMVRALSENVFEAKTPISRARVMVLLDRLVELYIHQSGVYGDTEKLTEVEGNVLISKNAVNLRNMKIGGNVYLAPGIGEYYAEITLRDTEVAGTVFVDNAMMRQLNIRDSSVETIVVNSERASINAIGDTGINRVTGDGEIGMNTNELNRGAPGFVNKD